MPIELGSYRLAAKKNRDRLTSGLGWFSIGLGLVELLAPRAVCRLIGVKPRATLVRLLGAREIASGLGLLTQKEQAAWIQSRLAGDALDLALMGAAFLDEDTDRTQLAIATAAVASVTAIDAFCAHETTQCAGLRPPRAGQEGSTQIKRSLIVNRPPADLYKLWRDFESLPRFMSHVKSVQKSGERQWHWTIKGPGGLQVQWEAELVEDRPDCALSWKSLPNADVDNSGSVLFEPAPGNRGTIVRVELSYRPPGGKAGATLAKILGHSPEKKIAIDLLRFKQLVETGEIARTEGQPAGRTRSTSRKYDDLVRA